MNYAQYLEKGKTIESTESLIEKVINSQGLDENALQELVNRAQSQDSKAIEFLLMLQQQSGVSKFEKPSGPIVKKDQQDPNMPVTAETGTVDGRKYTYMPYQGEGRGPIDRFEYMGQDGNTYGMTIQGPDTTYVMNGQQYNDPEGQSVIKERRAAVIREKCGGSVKKKETGDKITRKKVMAKGGCSCMIKKVGGRLIEVDSCTGLPVHRNGGNIVEVDCEGNVIYSKFGKGGRIPKHGLGDVIKRIWNNYTLNLTDPYGHTVSQKEVPSVEKVVGKTPQTVEQFQQQVKPITESPILVYRTSTQSPGRPQYDINTTYMYNNGLSRVTTAPVDLSVNPNIANQSGYIAYPSGTYRTVEADRANNFLSELNGDLPSILNPKVAPNAPYVDLAAAKKQALQASQQTYNQQEKAKQSEQEKIRQHNNRVSTFYSKMSDSDKRALQDMLKSAGYYKGEIDGLIGNGTLSALRKFQQDNKLAVDGMAGRNTFDALRAKTRQVAQPTTDPTAVPGYTQAMQLLNQMNGSISATPVKTGGPAGGMGLNDVHQSRDVQLVGPKVGLNLTAGLEIPQRKQGGQLNYANYLN